MGHRRFLLWHLVFVHGSGHPLTGHLEKPLLQFRIARHSGEPHAVARVIDAVYVYIAGHGGTPLAVVGGSAIGLSATST
jgi:hypothetical protein